jgi:hypothetical protein
MRYGVLGARLGGMLHLHIAIHAESQLRGADHCPKEHRREHGDFDPGCALVSDRNAANRFSIARVALLAIWVDITFLIPLAWRWRQSPWRRCPHNCSRKCRFLTS